MTPPGATNPTLEEPRPVLAHLSLRFWLIAFMAVIIAILAGVQQQFFASRLDAVTRLNAERKAIGIASVVASALAPGVEFEDAQNVQELLSQLSSTPEVLFAAVYKPNSQLLAAWNPERVTFERLRAPDVPRAQFDADALHVVAPVRTRSGWPGAILLGFSTAEMEHCRRENHSAGMIITFLTMMLGLLAALIFGSSLVTPGHIRLSLDIQKVVPELARPARKPQDQTEEVRPD